VGVGVALADDATQTTNTKHRRILPFITAPYLLASNFNITP
jgi:hypothetical protein